MTTSTTFFVGPLRVEIEATLPAFERRIDEQLRVFESRWDAISYEVCLRVRPCSTLAVPAVGTYLQCSRMMVDRDGPTLYATTRSGASARLQRTWPGGEAWTIDFPAQYLDTPELDELEDLVGLALVTGWRAAGWLPVHGGGVTTNGRCAILCAMSGGGKSTLTAALVRHGWHTLGDDKLLLRANGNGSAEIGALLHTMNLHPQTREWFGEVGDLERLPLYSAWTVKRKVRVEDVWPGRTIDRAHPTHVLRVRRDGLPGPIRVSPLSDEDVFRTLIGQIAIPNDRKVAATAMRAVSTVVRSGLRGLDVVVGEHAYKYPDPLAALDEALA
jgi:hypothetical protein